MSNDTRSGNPAKKAAAKKAAAARRAEARQDDAVIEFDYGGHTYSVERDAVNDVEMLELAEEGKDILAVRQVLGREQWMKFKDRHRTDTGRVPGEALEGLLQTMFDEVGQGNS